jgi:hypothetical protein
MPQINANNKKTIPKNYFNTTAFLSVSQMVKNKELLIMFVDLNDGFV